MVEEQQVVLVDHEILHQLVLLKEIMVEYQIIALQIMEQVVVEDQELLDLMEHQQQEEQEEQVVQIVLQDHQ